MFGSAATASREAPRRVASASAPSGIEARVGQASAETRVLIDQNDLGAGPRRAQRRRHAGRPAADHRDVAPAIRLVEVAVRACLVHPPEAGAAADDRLPEFPRAAWAGRSVL